MVLYTSRFSSTFSNMNRYNGKKQNYRHVPCKHGDDCKFLRHHCGCNFYHPPAVVAKAKMAVVKYDQKRYEEQENDRNIRFQQYQEERKKKEHEEILKKEQEVHDKYYGQKFNYIRVIAILEDDPSIHNIPKDVLKIIWEFVTMRKYINLEYALRPDDHIYNTNLCAHCKLESTTFTIQGCMRGACKMKNYFILGKRTPIALIHKETQRCFFFHVRCLLEAGLSVHDSATCQKESCPKCQIIRDYRLESAHKKYTVVNLFKQNNFFCNMFRYHRQGNDIGLKCHDPELKYVEDTDIKRATYPIYHIRDPYSYQLLLAHSPDFPPNKCMVCQVNGYSFLCDGIRLCDNIRCHMTFGITILHLVT
jgi:hypothetical protein